MKEELKVKKIKDGTVIDHIKAGLGKKVLDILGIGDGFSNTTALLMNVPSEKIGRKDIVKIENKTLKKEEVDKIALIAPNATWNVIKDFKVVRKSRIEIPDMLEGILKCPNPKCITNSNEPIKPNFIIEEKEPVRLRCNYCERLFDLKDVL
ncbi:MAG: aspartate carbamoyltransferase regulatory subunit [Candidatus Aenigmarchaeota archaeon]|nr:aspartate carbamoyltransferase regulatory subunit [Candidatus Aenigmarchaeota archaeon]